MKLRRSRYLGWIITAVIVVAAIAYALQPRAIKVEQVSVERQLLQTTIEADAIVRARERFVVAMPATGVLERLISEPGDSVVAGQIIGFVIPPELDQRQISEALARQGAMQAALAEVRQRLAALRPIVEQAGRRSERLDRLEDAGAVAREQAENARDAYAQMQHESDALGERERAAAFEVSAVRALLGSRPGQRVAIRAPVAGVILRRYEQSERTIMAGSPIMEIGSIAALEVVIDLLSADAVRVRPGMQVQLSGWGGDSMITAVVRRIEPSARTQVSSLGIEEQRVNVIADLKLQPRALGDGFRVEASVITHRAENALCIPLGTLLRDGDQWNVLVIDNGRLRRQQVTLGHRSALMASVTAGLRQGDRLVQHPSETLREGDRVE